MVFSISEIIEFTTTWLVKGDLNTDMLAANFQFFSPFWQSNNRIEFIDKFKNTSDYKEQSLSNIIKFDPLIKLTSSDNQHFSIVLQYHTKNGSSVYEAVLGTIANGMLIELRSIYDLNATKKAHELK